MDFNLSEDHQLLADTLRRFLAERAGPEARDRVAWSAPYHDPGLWRDLAGLGILGAFVAEEDGGFGGTAEDVAVIFEELGRALCVEPVLGTMMGLRLLSRLGQAAGLVDEIMAGDTRVALAVCEPQVSCDLSHVATEARETAGGWRLDGRKSAVYGAPGAGQVLVVARSPRGIGLFRVETPPLVCAAMADGGGTAELILEDRPADCLSPDCQDLIEETLDLGRIALCAEAVGIADRLIEMTIAYLGQRVQFGRPIASFQALQHRVVDMVVEQEQGRSITLSAVAAHGTPAGPRHCAMAKNLVGRMGHLVGEEAIQLHGGIGMTWEYPGAHYARRLIMIDHQLGDRHDHARRLVAMAAQPVARARAA